VGGDKTTIICFLGLAAATLAATLLSAGGRILSFAAPGAKAPFVLASPPRATDTAKAGAPIGSSGPFTVYSQPAERPTVVVGNMASEPFLFTIIDQAGNDRNFVVPPFERISVELPPGGYSASVLDPITRETLAKGTALLETFRTYRVDFVPADVDEIPTFHIGQQNAVRP
jgi:hypothetical protein